MTIDLLLDTLSTIFFGSIFADMILPYQMFCVLVVFSIILFLFIFYVKFVLWLFKLAGG